MPAWLYCRHSVACRLDAEYMPNGVGIGHDGSVRVMLLEMTAIQFVPFPGLNWA
jgi:hypothetical protein